VSRSSLEAAVPPNTEILLDTSVVLAYLNASEAANPAATVVIDDFVRTGRNRATISVVSVAETLVRPVAAGAAARPGEPDDAPCAHHRHGVERRDLDRSRERREVGDRDRRRGPHRHALPPGRARAAHLDQPAARAPSRGVPLPSIPLCLRPPNRAATAACLSAFPLRRLDPGEQHGTPAAPRERLDAMGRRAQEHEVVGRAAAPQPEAARGPDVSRVARSWTLHFGSNPAVQATT